MIECSIDCNMEYRILNNIAVQILLTENPSTILSARSTIAAFMINRNKPNVKIVIGNVKIIKIGLKNTFKSTKTTAAISALVYGGVSVTPGNNLAKIMMAMALKTSFTISFIGD